MLVRTSLRQGALNAIEQHANNLSELSVMLADGGYTGQPFADTLLTLIEADVEGFGKIRNA